MSINQIFSKIYENKSWIHGSGVGSLVENTIAYRTFLENFIKVNKISTILDYGCGDWQFSHLIPWSDLNVSYTGIDVVPSVIENNSNNYSKNNINFDVMTEEWKWPNVDLIICKDVLQHLPNNLIKELLDKMLTHSKYILITNDIHNKNKTNLNLDIKIGDYRPLNLREAPWNINAEIKLNWKVRSEIKETILIKGHYEG